MLFNLTSLSSEPIHSQISKQLLEKILTDDYYDGTELPSPRALASEQFVNVNSVERAYRTLIEEQLIEVRNGARYFVPVFSDEKREELRFRLLVEKSSLNAIQSLSGQLISVFDTSTLKNIYVTNIKQHLGVQDVLIVLQNDELSGFELSVSENFRDVSIIDKKDPLLNKIANLDSAVQLRDISSGDQQERLAEVFSNRNVKMLIPLIHDKTFIGAIALSEKINQTEFSHEEIGLFSVLTNQFVVAYETARYYAEAMEKRRMQEEINMAAQIQENLLPKKLPDNAFVRVNAYCKPSRAIGGDFYDYLPINEKTFGLVIADACGKGLPAAMLISQLQAMIKSEVHNQNSIEKIMENINNQMVSFTPRNKFITLFYGVYHWDKKEFIYAGAGHNYPMVIHKNGTLDYLKSGGPGLGLVKGASYRTGTVHLEPDDLLLLYTDGVTESMNESREEYGEERLIKTVKDRRQLNPGTIIQNIINDLDGFSSEKLLQDDRTLLLMKCLA